MFRPLGRSAIDSWKLACEQGDVDCSIRLAPLWGQGGGWAACGGWTTHGRRGEAYKGGVVKKDSVQAAQFFKAAADAGNARGASAFGRCRQKGRGVARAPTFPNEVEAVRLVGRLIWGRAGDARRV
jgi:TPR repeat protein